MPELMTNQDAIEYLLYMKHNVHAKSPMDIALDTAIEALKQPTISPEVRHGRWILCEDQTGVDNDNNNYAYFCSQCHHQDVHSKFAKVNFCWNCGSMNSEV